MSALSNTLQNKQKSIFISHETYTYSPKPLIFQSDQSDFEKNLINFLRSNSISSIYDYYEGQLKELFFIRNPSILEGSKEAEIGMKRFFDKHKGDREDFANCGAWVFYPWTRILIHVLSSDLHQEIRTARNRFLLTEQEQAQFRKFVVGIAGLSIGNSVALAIAYSGGCENMKLADPDFFEATNLNRVRVPLNYLSVKKVYVAAQQIYEINPYANLILYPEGINSKNLEDFLAGVPALNLIIDEMDDLKMKIFIRLAARAVKLPLVMATDNGDNGIIDVERYDLPEYKSNFDNLPKINLATVVRGLDVGEPLNLTPFEKVRLATRIVGPENAAPRMQESLMEVGKKIVSWPQLGIAAFTGGTVLAYVVKKIALGENNISGKFQIPLDKIFLPDYNSEQNINKRKKLTEKLINYLDYLASITSENYNVWETDEKKYPSNGALLSKIKFILRYAVMAPSSHNTQPWKFKISSNQIWLYLDSTRTLPISDPTLRESYISLGACIANLFVALAYFGFRTKVKYFPKNADYLIAKIEVESYGKTDMDLNKLFHSIKKRYSDRSIYKQKLVSEKILSEIVGLSHEDLTVTVVTEKKLKEKIADLVAAGSSSIMKNEEFRNELSKWLRHNFTMQAFGMPGENFGMNDIQSIIAPLLIKNFDLSSDQMEHDRKAVLSSAALIVISSASDDMESWLKIGQLYERILLTTTTYRISSATLASVVEVGDLPEKLAYLLGIEGKPQVFFRIGYSDAKVSHSPRIPIEKLLINN